MKSYEMKETIEKVPGEVKQGEEHDEFIVDNEKIAGFSDKTILQTGRMMLYCNCVSSKTII